MFRRLAGRATGSAGQGGASTPASTLTPQAKGPLAWLRNHMSVITGLCNSGSRTTAPRRQPIAVSSGPARAVPMGTGIYRGVANATMLTVSLTPPRVARFRPACPSSTAATIRPALTPTICSWARRPQTWPTWLRRDESAQSSLRPKCWPSARIRALTGKSRPSTGSPDPWLVVSGGGRLGRTSRVILVGFGLALFALADAQSHDLYQDWRQPYTNASCCNGHDCHPTTATLDENGNWVARHLGRDVKIPWARVMKGPSPDGRSHLCISDSGVVHCFMPSEIRS